METVPKNWLTIRYGGDEFLIVGNSRNYNGEDYCTKIKERLAAKAVQGVGLLLDMLRLLFSSFSGTFGMVLEPCSEMFLLVLIQIWMLK